MNLVYIRSGISQQPFDHNHILTLRLDDQTVFLQILQMKATLNERRTQDIKS
jgi:hypothetical protein